MAQYEELRKRLESKSIVKVCGAFDAMSAKLVEINNFDAIWSGSFAISSTHGVPDASILTMTEFFDVASNMAQTCNIPVIADCDTGYGGPSNVMHMVKKYENAGIAAVCIEDKTFPKRNSLLKDGANELISEKEFVAKILAAKDAKQNKDFMIIARVESLISGMSMSTALQRAEAYEEAGADAILIHSKQKNPDEIFEFADSFKGNCPVVVIPTTYDTVKINELGNHNIKMVIYANQTLRAAHLALTNLLQKMKDANSMDDIQNEMSSMDEIFELQKMFEIHSQEKDIETKLKNMGYIN